jgi:hypothetical protein
MTRAGELASAAASPVKPQPRRVERYWLCDRCAEVWTLVYDRHRGIILVPQSRPPVAARIAAEGEYRETA